MAKRFFYVCAGLFLLAGVYALGAKSAGAQMGSQVSGFAMVGEQGGSQLWILTSNGDVFMTTSTGGGGPVAPAVFRGNIWGGPMPNKEDSFGGVKSRYR